MEDLHHLDEEDRRPQEETYRKARRLQLAMAAVIAGSILSISLVLGVGAYVIHKERGTASQIATIVEDNRDALCTFRDGIEDDAIGNEAAATRTWLLYRDIQRGNRPPIRGLRSTELKDSAIRSFSMAKTQYDRVRQLDSHLKCESNRVIVPR